MYISIKCDFCKKESVKNRNGKYFKRVFCNNICHGKWIIKNRVNKFWSKVIKKSNNKCWKWSGTKHKFGYGHFLGCGSHRFSYEIHYGKIPNTKNVLHSCNNPECTNPKHLRLGTTKDNALDRSLAGSINGLKSGNTKFKKGDINKIKLLYKKIESSRKVAKIFNVSKKVILDIINKKTYVNDF